MASIHYRGTFRDNGHGANEATTIEDVAEVDLGLGRDEEAELVALLIHEARTEIDQVGAWGNNGEALRAGFELSRDEDVGVLTQNRTEVDLSNNSFEGDAPTNALSRQIALDDPDILWFSLGRCQLTADSTGEITGIDQYTHGPEHILYRDYFGSGPVFLSSDDLHLHGRVNSVSRDSNWVADIMYSAYFDVRPRS
jgi:hypothetical protein